MLPEEEQLDNLCSLLDRLSNTYGSNSPPKSTVNSKSFGNNTISGSTSFKFNKPDSQPIVNSVYPVNKKTENTVSSPKKKSSKKDASKSTVNESKSVADNVQQSTEEGANLTQEEKKSIKKSEERS